MDVDWQGHVQYDTNVYDTANTENPVPGSVPDRGPVTGYDGENSPNKNYTAWRTRWILFPSFSVLLAFGKGRPRWSYPSQNAPTSANTRTRF